MQFRRRISVPRSDACRLVPRPRASQSSFTEPREPAAVGRSRKLRQGGLEYALSLPTGALAQQHCGSGCGRVIDAVELACDPDVAVAQREQPQRALDLKIARWR